MRYEISDVRFSILKRQIENRISLHLQSHINRPEIERYTDRLTGQPCDNYPSLDYPEPWVFLLTRFFFPGLHPRRG
ncbi:MAG: hypothetical protein WD604_06600, partial [Balneolaceae bacterium]